MMSILERARGLAAFAKEVIPGTLNITWFAEAREMAELLGKLADKLEVVVEHAGDLQGCPPGVSRCPEDTASEGCPKCWQEWLDS